MAPIARGERAAAGTIVSVKTNGFTRARRASSARASWASISEATIPLIIDRSRAEQDDVGAAADPASARARRADRAVSPRGRERGLRSQGLGEPRRMDASRVDE